MVTLLIRPVIERGLASMPDATPELGRLARYFFYRPRPDLRRHGLSGSGHLAQYQCRESPYSSRLHLAPRLGAERDDASFVFTPLIHVYTNTLLNVPENLRELILVGSQAAILLPMITTLQATCERC